MQEFARLALEWLAGQDATSDYIRNMKLVCSQETLLGKHFGLAVSLPAAYRKAMDLIPARAERPVSQHVGRVKDKISVVARVEKIIAYESNYGFGDMVKMRDRDTGNLFVWFTGSLTRCETVSKGEIIKPIQEGDLVDLRGTVKGHDDFRGEKQTTLTRCKLSPKSEALAVAS